MLGAVIIVAAYTGIYWTLGDLHVSALGDRMAKLLPSSFLHSPTTVLYDHLVVGVFLSGGLVCMCCSTLYHLSLIFASFVPSIYYGFYCAKSLKQVYLSALGFLSLLTSFVLLSGVFVAPRFRGFRIGCFVALALSGIIPSTHIFFKYGSVYWWGVGGGWLVLMAALYLAGVAVFVTRVPERFAPGRFDLIGNSHQIWHLFVMLAMFSHYFGVRRAYSFWHEVEGDTGMRDFACTL
ncbi:MAG: hypothetical protein SGCHY_004992 [Lobulomycetales sp.]